MADSARCACIIGYPAAHSRSPLIHNYWLRQHGLAGEYRRETVAPEAFDGFIRALPAHGYVGANVTIPHKEAAFAAVEPDETARATGSVNTVWIEDGRLRGTSTDGAGFLTNLDACAPGWNADQRPAVVLGAGGSSRAVVHALLARGVETVRVVNRTAGRAESLRAAFGPRVVPHAWEVRSAALADAALLVNTLPPGSVADGAIGLCGLAESATVADITYVPLKTAILIAAQARGLKTADGLGMLLHQAAPGFALWFGVRPTVTPELRALVEADLSA